MSAIVNLAAEQARRRMDPLLDAVDQIRGELQHACPTEITVRLRELTERLAEP